MNDNLTWHPSQVAAADRHRLYRNHPCTLWLTGLPGAGKSTLAYATERALVDRGHACYVLDGDNVRHGLNRDLGFSAADRSENIRRIAEVARLMNDAGLIVICAFISPARTDRATARQIVGDPHFVEIHLATPLATCEARDTKGLYRRARAGQIADFTGIGAPYEAPASPALRIDTTLASTGQSVGALLDYLSGKDLLAT